MPPNGLHNEEFEQQLPSTERYVEAMQAIEQEMAKNARAMLRTHYNAPDHTLTATDLATAMKYSNY
jgi:hypothetical protein